MSRKHIRAAKRSISRGQSPSADPGDLVLSHEAALWLLDRSIEFGHGKLAVLRLSMAAKVGATIGADRWHYCRRMAQSDEALQEIFNDCVALASAATAVGVN